jgi:hypothetical protein
LRAGSRATLASKYWKKHKNKFKKQIPCQIGNNPEHTSPRTHPQTGGKDYFPTFAPVVGEVLTHVGLNCPLTLVGAPDGLGHIACQSHYAKDGLSLQICTYKSALTCPYLRCKHFDPLRHLSLQICTYICQKVRLRAHTYGHLDT